VALTRGTRHHYRYYGLTVTDGSSGPALLTRRPLRVVEAPTGPIPSFVAERENNLDAATVGSFGREWQRFHTFTDAEIESGGAEYFADLLPADVLRGARVLDLGCGSGRWTQYLASRASFVEAVDPSAAAAVAARATAGFTNVRVVQAGVGGLPFAPESFDGIVSVGVLHHVPDTAHAISAIAPLVRPGGWLYLYLYYRLDDQPAAHRVAFAGAHLLRLGVSRLPPRLKTATCEVLAWTVYGPLVLLGRVLRRLAPSRSLHLHLPLHYYVDKPWRIARNDALDRFGTPIERRFTRNEIREMLERAGFSDIRFGDSMPKWRVLARKP
jgi:SAM-dependent methyltransferase